MIMMMMMMKTTVTKIKIGIPNGAHRHESNVTENSENRGSGGANAVE